MSTTTANLQLIKSAVSDNIDQTIGTDLPANFEKIDLELMKRVEKVDGKGLSTNDYSTGEKNKLETIATSATKVADSTTNGNILINDVEVTAYDDTEVQAELDALAAQKADNTRVDAIITTPVESVSAQEIIDARQGAASLGANLTTVKAQINTLDAELFKIDPMQYKIRKPIITFVSDDGGIGDWEKLKLSSETYGIPMVSALITGLTTGINQDYVKLKYLQNELGWEIASHTHNHLNLTTLTATELEYQLKTPKEILSQQGINCKNLVYPFGSSDQNTREVGKKYYRCGVALSTPNGTNSGVIPSYDVKRVALGSWFDNSVEGLPATNTLEYYKARVLQCFNEKSWLVFMLHPGDADHNITQQEYLDSTIAYIQSLDIEVMTLDNAFDIFGNLWESGNFVKDTFGTALSGIGVNKIGEELNSELTVHLENSSGITNATPITGFKRNVLSVVSFESDGTNGFPTTAGTLITYYSKTNSEQSYQMWHDYHSSAVFRRMWRSAGWTVWDRLVTQSFLDTNLFNRPAERNAYTNDTPITDYPNNSITTCYINSTGSSGFPGIGLLTTYRIGENGVHRQEFRVYNYNQIWNRYVNTSGAWTAWVRLGGGSGTTANRPTAATAGYCYYDTTLGRPIWLTTTPNVWINSTGTVV